MSFQSISAHYGRSTLWRNISFGLRDAGLDLEHLTVESLAPLDQFHTRGREATLELIQSCDIQPKTKVLDAGGGIGGTARTLASLLECQVTVLDLTEEFCEVGRKLTAAMGLSERVQFETGSATEIPFADDAFDYVVTQHLTMNIADKEKLFREVLRVLRPGGRLAMHEFVAGPSGPVLFPVPWARTPDMSDLRPPEALRAVITSAGLRELRWVDETDKGREFFGRRATSILAGETPPLNLGLLLGRDYGTLFITLARNFGEGRVQVVQAVFEKPATTSDAD